MAGRRRRVALVLAAGAPLAFAGAGPSNEGALLDVPGVPLGVTAVDVDGDARPDLVVRLRAGPSRLALLRNRGVGRFDPAVALPDVPGATPVALRRLLVSDVDHDGDLDLVGVGSPSALWRNDGAGNFVAESLPPQADGDRGALLDLDGDAAPDLVLTRDDAASPIRPLANDGTGRFTALAAVERADAGPFANLLVAPAPGDASAVADLDGDSRDDLATATTSPRPGIALLLSAPATTGTVASPALKLLRGRLHDGPGRAADRLALAGVIPDAVAAAITPGAAVRVRVQAGGARFDADSAQSSRGVRVKVDAARRRFSVRAAGFDFGAAAGNPVTVTIETAGASRSHSAAWHVVRRGDLLWTGRATREPERADAAAKAVSVSPFDLTTTRADGKDVPLLVEKATGRAWTLDAATGRWVLVAKDAARDEGSLGDGLVASLPLTASLANAAGRDAAVARGGVEFEDGVALFDGSGWIELPHIPLDRRAHAFSMWVRPEGGSQVMGLVEQRDSGAGGHHYHLMLRGRSQPYLGFYMNDLAAPDPVTHGEWHHLVFQYTGAKQQIWVDGALVAEHATAAYEGTTGATRIGRDPGWTNVGGTNFVGAMRSVRIYSRSLTPAEIADLRTREMPPSAAKPAGATLTFDGPIDGSDRVVITATEARWENVFWGTWREDVTLNGVVWNPRKNPVLKNDGATRFLPPGVDLTKARLVSRSGRDHASIEIDHGRLILRFVDSPNGIGHYRLVVAFD